MSWLTSERAGRRKKGRIEHVEGDDAIRMLAGRSPGGIVVQPEVPTEPDHGSGGHAEREPRSR